MLIDSLSITTPLNDPTILELPTAYCTDITRNILELLDGRLACYEPIPTVTKQMCRIVIPTSLHHTIFNMIHTTPITAHMGEYKTLYRI